MQHDLKVIAKNQHLDADELIDYARKFGYRYGIKVNGEVYTCPTPSTDRLVEDFMEFKEPKRLLQMEDVVGLTFLGWSSSVESTESSTVVWQCKSHQHLIYATPNWDKDGETPFCLVRDGDQEYGGEDILTLYTSKRMSLDYQKELYLKTLKAVIEII